MRVWAVFKKSLVEQFRDYKAVLLTILSPIVFIVIFGLAFGQGFYTYSLAISNEDQGELGGSLVQQIVSSEYPNGNTMFKTIQADYDKQELLEGIRKGTYDAHLYIPAGFSESLLSNKPYGQSSQVQLKLLGNPANLTYSFISSFVENYIHNFVWTNGMAENPVQIVYEKTGEVKVQSEFENMAPGLMVFSVFFLLILSSMVVTRELENRTIQRIILSKVRAFEFCAGVSLSQMVLAAIMLPLVFASSLLLGFSSSGSYALAYLVSLIATFSAIGIGLIIAAFCRTSLEAFIIGNVVVTPMMFLAGIFFKVPPVKLFTVMGKEIELLTFVPTLDAVSAMNKILINNAGFREILPEIIVLVLLSAGYFLMGRYLFSRKIMHSGGVK
ncbi:ABC transporter permease subunit [Paenibacillus sp. LMG 31459]|uniref:ABC transporter permease subunit n=1 Tax=Paenibacillus phytohabitans TaxID=2654978 RepID=A0ABX1YDK1_9BACL|nr:ABC transporter permease [Paenibacillus phytohabitans]NOU79078.1 ABC transporter permease subunit [Paenibacillus phytohabitans]